MHICGIFTDRSRVCVSSYRGAFPLVIHTVSLHLSHSLLRGINESRERRERMRGRAVALGRKRVRKGIR